MTAHDSDGALEAARAAAGAIRSSSKSPPRDKRGFELRMWGDVAHPTMPDRLVRKVLGTGSFAALVGQPGCGKSFFALDLALALARGVPFFGRGTAQGAALFVSAEGHAGFANRLLAYRKHHAIECAVAFGYLAVAPDLGPNGDDADRIIETAEQLAQAAGMPVAVIVIDTVARALAGADENSSADMGAFIAHCDRIRAATGATVLVVHHTGKDASKGLRGHSSLLGACDTTISVERIGDTAERVATLTKQKDGADGEAMVFALRSVEIGRDDLGEPITSCVIEAADVTSDEATAARIRAALTQSQRRALDCLHDALARSGAVPPPNDHIPANTPVVPIRVWRETADSRTLTESDTAQAKQKAFRRAVTGLVSAGRVEIWKDVAWVIR